jgi:hypothetical protein
MMLIVQIHRLVRRGLNRIDVDIPASRDQRIAAGRQIRTMQREVATGLNGQVARCRDRALLADQTGADLART